MAQPDEPKKDDAPSAAPAAKPESGHGDRRSMLRSAGLVSFMTILSRILGLWRDRLMAAIFGASGFNDAFNLAFLLPNLTRRLFGEGALSSVFVPVFSERLATNRRAEAFRTASILLTRLALLLFVLCLVFVGVSMAAVKFGGLSKQRELTLNLANWMIFYCVLINIAAVMMSILNSLGHFLAGAFSPVLLNLCMILSCTIALDWMGTDAESRIYVQAVAVLAGGALQLAMMIPPALSRGFKFTPALDTADEGYREVMSGFLPTIANVALFQINLLMDQVIATVFIPEEGPVTMLAYGNRLIQLPWAIFSLSVATAALPMLSRLWAEQKKDEFARGLSTAVRSTLYLAVPSTVGLCLLSTDLTRLFYGTGEFLKNDGEAVIRTGNVVFYFALGLCFYSLNAIMARAIYATKDTKTPTRAAAVSVAVNITLNLLFVLGTEMRESGLALASAISGAVQTAILVRAVYRKLERRHMGRAVSFAAALVGGLCLGTAAAILAYRFYARDPSQEQVIAFIVAAVASVAVLGGCGDAFFAKELGLPSIFTRLMGSGEKDTSAGANLYYGVPEEKWTTDLVLYHGLFTTAMASTVMGLCVWTVRDSLPPEGHSFALVFQRAIVPVAVGVFVYVMASSIFQSREYDELKAAFGRRRKPAPKA
ncbi:MAG: murein biosynthesis integral membrane protein MurJ [Planctomycetota bacterium]|nr:murein biosynthesis integral membrane protein MurJ [Planctomycetota bacterium]